MICVYIIKSSKDNGYYIGISKDISGRLVKHNKGAVRSTKSRRPWKLVYTEEHQDYKEAHQREVRIKSFKGGNSFKALINKYCGMV